MKEKCSMQLSENAHRVLQARYLRRDAQGRVSETPDQLFARVVRAIAHAELLLFALSYRRVGVLEGQTLTECNPLLLSLGERMGFLTTEVLGYITSHGTLAGAPNVPDAIREMCCLSTWASVDLRTFLFGWELLICMKSHFKDGLLPPPHGIQTKWVL
jgi:hypothetical protein